MSNIVNYNLAFVFFDRNNGVTTLYVSRLLIEIILCLFSAYQLIWINGLLADPPPQSLIFCVLNVKY